MKDEEIVEILRGLRKDQQRYRMNSQGHPERIVRFTRNIDALDVAIITFDPEGKG